MACSAIVSDSKKYVIGYLTSEIYYINYGRRIPISWCVSEYIFRYVVRVFNFRNIIYKKWKKNTLLMIWFRVCFWYVFGWCNLQIYYAKNGQGLIYKKWKNTPP